MGCRSFLQGWKNEKGEDVSDGRMNLGVVTLNIPRIAVRIRWRQRAILEHFRRKIANL